MKLTSSINCWVFNILRDQHNYAYNHWLESKGEKYVVLELTKISFMSINCPALTFKLRIKIKLFLTSH